MDDLLFYMVVTIFILFMVYNTFLSSSSSSNRPIVIPKPITPLITEEPGFPKNKTVQLLSSDYVKYKRISLDSITSNLAYISIKVYNPYSNYQEFPTYSPNTYTDNITLYTAENGAEFISYDPYQNILLVDLRIYTQVFGLSRQDSEEDIKKLKIINLDDLIIDVDIKYFQTDGWSMFKIKNIEIKESTPTIQPTTIPPFPTSLITEEPSFPRNKTIELLSSDYVKNKRISLDSITSDLAYISIKNYTPPYDQFPNPNIYIDTNTIKLGTIQNGVEFVSFDSNQNILSVDLRVYTIIFNLSTQEAQENIKKLKTITIDDLIFYVDINYFQTEGLSKFKIKNIEIFVPTLAPTE
jgi:hypothetical protein